MARPRGLKTAKLGGQNRRDILVRMPGEAYDGLAKVAFRDRTTLSFQVNRAIKDLLIKEGLKE